MGMGPMGEWEEREENMYREREEEGCEGEREVRVLCCRVAM